MNYTDDNSHLSHDDRFHLELFKNKHKKETESLLLSCKISTPFYFTVNEDLKAETLK